MRAWLAASLAAFLDWLGVAVAYTLGFLTLAGVFTLLILLEVEKYRDDQKKEVSKE